jgi:hypothetical protein
MQSENLNQCNEANRAPQAPVSVWETAAAAPPCRHEFRQVPDTLIITQRDACNRITSKFEQKNGFFVTGQGV